VDLAGLLAPEEVVERMLCEIEDGGISNLEQVANGFRSMHEDYPEYEWAWAADTLRQRLGKAADEITADDVIELTTRWKTAVVELDRMLHADAKKEFTAIAQIGYGLDGEQEAKQADFENVRGTFKDNGFVLEIEQHIANKTKLGDELIGRMKGLSRDGAC